MEQTIYCLGDSNTRGFDPRSFFGEAYERPWPLILGELTGCRTVNDGENGRRIQDCCRSYELLKKNLDREQPELLIVLLGSNDLLWEDSPEQIGGRMEQLLRRLREDFRDLSMLLLTPPEIRIPGPYRQAGEALTPGYRRAAEKYGADFLELTRGMLPLSCDGVHLTEEGHRQLAGILRLHLQETAML